MIRLLKSIHSLVEIVLNNSPVDQSHFRIVPSLADLPLTSVFPLSINPSELKIVSLVKVLTNGLLLLLLLAAHLGQSAEWPIWATRREVLRCISWLQNLVKKFAFKTFFWQPALPSINSWMGVFCRGEVFFSTYIFVYDSCQFSFHLALKYYQSRFWNVVCPNQW